MKPPWPSIDPRPIPVKRPPARTTLGIVFEFLAALTLLIGIALWMVVLPVIGIVLGLMYLLQR